MKDIAYGIHQGSIHEGGGTGRNLYKKKGDAISEAIKIFENNVTRSEKSVENPSKEDEFYESKLKHKEQFSWRRCDEYANRWHNTVDEIEIVEYTIN
jgi:hypothetical protein